MQREMVFWRVGAGTVVDQPPTPSVKRDMRPLALVMLSVLLIGMGVYVRGQRPAERSGSANAATVRVSDGRLHPAVAALSGVWEGLRPDAFPSRLVVYELHEEWAAILIMWGNHPEATYGGGSLHARAKVSQDGKLFWHRMGGITFQLSEDWTTLVVTQEAGGRIAVGLMRRVPAEVTAAHPAQGSAS